MEEPPAKRPRRVQDAAVSDDRYNKSSRNTSHPDGRPPLPSERGNSSRLPHDDSRNSVSTSSRPNERQRRRSRSPRQNEGDRDRHQRQRSRSPRRSDRDYRERDVRRHRERIEQQRHEDRSRSRSRETDRFRDRENDASKATRDYRRHGRKRSRSTSPIRNGTTSTTSRQVKSESKSSLQNGAVDVTQRDSKAHNNDVDDDSVDAMIKRMMGFSSFKSTQNTKVPGNQIYGVRKEKKTEYRQYMNRPGGFNRPLSPGR